MKQLTLILALVVMAGCTSGNSEQATAQPKIQQNIKSEFGAWGLVYEFDIDGCKYLCAKSGDAVSIIHKQNCNNPIHSTNR